MSQSETGTESESSVEHEGDTATDITLEEIRLRYQEELDRRQSVEAKIGIVLTINALIISLVGLFSETGLVLYAAMILALLSVFVGIRGLWVRDYHSPGREIEDFLQHTDETPDALRNRFIISYIDSLTENEGVGKNRSIGNKTKNDQKFNSLTACLKLTSVALVLILIHPLMIPTPTYTILLPAAIVIGALFETRGELIQLGKTVSEEVRSELLGLAKGLYGKIRSALSFFGNKLSESVNTSRN